MGESADRKDVTCPSFGQAAPVVGKAVWQLLDLKRIEGPALLVKTETQEKNQRTPGDIIADELHGGRGEWTVTTKTFNSWVSHAPNKAPRLPQGHPQARSGYIYI